jgi:hypothetical protein
MTIWVNNYWQYIANLVRYREIFLDEDGGMTINLLYDAVFRLVGNNEQVGR